eukprot:GHVN01073132.1.p2 GENE.GHVN01073132.1~~GHVN01073132.1.p2  ORF type:complete len:597 (+),score=143.13 GHVN01073132.1:1383-3173(+)
MRHCLKLSAVLVFLFPHLNQCRADDTLTRGGRVMVEQMTPNDDLTITEGRRDGSRHEYEREGRRDRDGLDNRDKGERRRKQDDGRPYRSPYEFGYETTQTTEAPMEPELSPTGGGDGTETTDTFTSTGTADEPTADMPTDATSSTTTPPTTTTTTTSISRGSTTAPVGAAIVEADEVRAVQFDEADEEFTSEVYKWMDEAGPDRPLDSPPWIEEQNDGASAKGSEDTSRILIDVDKNGQQRQKRGEGVLAQISSNKGNHGEERIRNQTDKGLQRGAGGRHSHGAGRDGLLAGMESKRPAKEREGGAGVPSERTKGKIGEMLGDRDGSDGYEGGRFKDNLGRDGSEDNADQRDLQAGGRVFGRGPIRIFNPVFDTINPILDGSILDLGRDESDSTTSTTTRRRTAPRPSPTNPPFRPTNPPTNRDGTVTFGPTLSQPSLGRVDNSGIGITPVTDGEAYEYVRDGASFASLFNMGMRREREPAASDGEGQVGENPIPPPIASFTAPPETSDASRNITPATGIVRVSDGKPPTSMGVDDCFDGLEKVTGTGSLPFDVTDANSLAAIREATSSTFIPPPTAEIDPLNRFARLTPLASPLP